MKQWIDYLVIVFVGLVTHGLLLLNDGIYWDAWLLYRYLVNKDSYLLSLWFIGAGRPIEYCFHQIMGCFPGFPFGLIFQYKLVAFLSIIFTAVLIYKICSKFNLVSRGESLLISLIVLTYPTFYIWVEMHIASYLFCYMLFFLAAFFTFKSEEAAGIIHYLWRTLSLIIFFISFSLSSLLVFFLGFILVLILRERHRHGFSWRQIGLIFLPRHIDYIILPFLFWIWNAWFFPLSVIFARDSHKLLKFNLLSIKKGFIGFLQYAFCDQWIEATERLLSLPLFMLLIILLAYLIYDLFRISKFRWFSPEIRSWYFIIFGVVMFIAGTFPYVATGLLPPEHTVMYNLTTRHALLLGLPMAIIITGLSKLIFSTKDGALNRFGFMLLSLIITAFILMNNHGYISWQARWVKDRSFMVNLARLENAGKYSTYWVDDQYLVCGENYRIFEYSSMFHQVWGGEKRASLIARNARERFDPKLFETLKPPNGVSRVTCYLRDYDPAGPQAELSICSAASPAISDFKLVMRYFYYRFLHPQRMQDFLAGITRVHVQPIPSSVSP